jgi:Fic family protein
VAKVLRRHWTIDFFGPSRSDGRSCEYEAYLPHPLAGRLFSLKGEVAADVAEAEAAVARLNVEATALIDTEALARILLRAEAVASSRIEGLEAGARRLLRAEVVRGLDGVPSGVTAAEVLGNIDAMAYGIERINQSDAITNDVLLGIHDRLLTDTRLEEYGGRFRDRQNWFGGSDNNPCSASFVPPPPEFVQDLIADLCAFCNDDSLPTIAQAAIAHAQFETIHPFVDGNGRPGRALIHLVFRRRGLALRILPPVSLVLATWSKSNIEALDGRRNRGPATGNAVRAGANQWIGLFTGACIRAVADSVAFEGQAREIQRSWRERIPTVRKNSSADLLPSPLPGAPVITANSAAALIGRSFPAANNVASQLVEAGILNRVSIGRRNRVYEAPEVIAAFTDLGRRLASPEGDTRTSEPVRREPRRRRERRRSRGDNLAQCVDAHAGGVADEVPLDSRPVHLSFRDLHATRYAALHQRASSASGVSQSRRRAASARRCLPPELLDRVQMIGALHMVGRTDQRRRRWGSSCWPTAADRRRKPWPIRRRSCSRG